MFGDIFCIISKYFGNKKGGQGPRLCEFVDIPKVFQKVLEYVQKPSFAIGNN